jgi:hypothetical protein
VSGNVSWKVLAEEILISYHPMIAGSSIFLYGRRGPLFNDSTWWKKLRAKVGAAW